MYLGGNKADRWGFAVKHEPSKHFYVKTLYELAPGDYTLEVSGRSFGYRIDRIVMWNRWSVEEDFALALDRPESLRDDGDDDDEPPADLPVVLKLMLIDASAAPAENIRLLEPDVVIKMGEIGASGLSLRCNAPDPNKLIDKVRFELGNGREKEDTDGRPYTLSRFDKETEAYQPVRYLSRPGRKTVTAKAIGASGLVVGTMTVTFTVQE